MTSFTVAFIALSFLVRVSPSGNWVSTSNRPAAGSGGGG